MNSPYLLMLLAQASQDDLRRTAAARNRHRLESEPPGDVTPGRRVAHRFGARADEDPVTSLAVLDGTERGSEPILLAEIDGQLCKALLRSDGTVVVDPFHLRAGLVELLRERVRQLEGAGQRRRRRRFHRSPAGCSP